MSTIFFRDEMVQVWAVHHLQLVGEAARYVSEGLKYRYPEVPWPQIIAMRNILVHEYFGVNLRQVWTMVDRDIAGLETNTKDPK